ESNRRDHRVAPPDPVPELEHIGSVNPELCHFCCVRRDGDKMPSDRFLVIAHTCQGPVASGTGVCHCLQSRERLRGDYEEGFSRIEITDCFEEVGGVNVWTRPAR